MKDTFDKVVMNEERQSAMRSELMGKKRAKRTWLAPVAAIAAAVAIVMIVPYTREGIVRAAGDFITAITVAHNGRIVKYVETPETVKDDGSIEQYMAMEISGKGESYVQEKDGRLFFVLDDKWTDITDKCSDSKYFTYEERYKDGTKMIVFIGGTVSDYCYVQVLFNEAGEAVSAICEGSDTIPTWAEKAFKDNGIVPKVISCST